MKYYIAPVLAFLGMVGWFALCIFLFNCSNQKNMDYELQKEETKKGNPIASNRFRWQTYTKATDDACESEWASTKDEAVRLAARDLIRQFEKFKKDDLIVKIFNEMNYKSKPTIITLDDAYKIQNNSFHSQSRLLRGKGQN